MRIKPFVSIPKLYHLENVSAFLIYLFRIFHLLPSGSNDKYLEAECSFKVPFFMEPNYVAHLSRKKYF